MSEIKMLTQAEIDARLVEIEAAKPGIKAAYEDPDWNHGDSCWHGHPAVSWSYLADEYDALRWLDGDRISVPIVDR